MSGWKNRFSRVGPLPRPRSRRRFPSAIHPPLYVSWSSQCFGYPTPGLVSTLFHHMYSAPRRSVQMFLQEMLHVWQPRHLSRLNTITSCARTSIALPPQLSDDDVAVAVHPGRPPVVEVVAELGIAAEHERRFEADAGQAVVHAAPPSAPFRFLDVEGPLRRMVHYRRPFRDARREDRPADDDAVGIVDLDRIIVPDPGARRVVGMQPDHLPAAGEGEHPEVVAVRGVDAPLAVGGQEIEHEPRLPFRLVQDRRGDLSLERRKFLVELTVVGMVQVEGLAAGKGPPRDSVFHVEGIGGVRPPLVDQPAPDCGADEAARLLRDLLPGHPEVAVPGGDL